MQAPAARFLRTPVRSRRRRCKHLRRRLRSVIAPSSKAHSKGAEPGLAMGLSTNFGRNRVIPSVLSTVRPRTRWRKGWWCGLGGPRIDPTGSSRSGRILVAGPPGLGRNRLATPPADGSETWKRPEEPSNLGRVPQSKLQRSQGFGPSAPSGKNNYARRHPTLATGLSTTFPVGRADSRRFSTAHPPARGNGGKPRGAGHNKTPEGTNRFAGPFPLMQAPAARFPSNHGP
jgi:hypothetical protein